LILTYASGLPAGRDSIALPPESGASVVPLDPALTAVQNAQRYFEKARHARRARERAQTRIASLKERHTAIVSLLERIETLTSREDFENFMKTESDKLAALGIKSSRKAHEEPPFRTFMVDGGFEVWAGKDNANNDLLTLKYARPHDLWFHARGVPGSHVVLRIATGKGPPGKKAREQAAGIAAYYSKMRRAGMVPVTMTERRHIRKPKGAPPGTVLVAREETVFATPGLPPASTPDTEDNGKVHPL
jgi:predicted ribosome quality control (RQC) complex YloA/Tae2 family protein